MQESSVNQQLMNKLKAQLQEDFYTNFKIVDITLTPPAINRAIIFGSYKKPAVVVRDIIVKKI